MYAYINGQTIKHRKEEKMEIGSKIKKARQLKNMTQTELCGDFVTRNMLSAIEHNKALPSLPVLEYFIEKLEISASYFFSNEEDPLPFMLEYKLDYFYKLYSEEKLDRLLNEIKEFDGCDSRELKLLQAEANFKLGQTRFIEGNLSLAEEHFLKSHRLFQNIGLTVMANNSETGLKVIEAFKNESIPSPFECYQHNKSTPDFIFYLYIIYMIDHGMTDKAASIYDSVKFEYQPFRYHINSRLAAAKFNYSRAKELLFQLVFIEEEKMPIPFMRKIIEELEDYCIKTGDYKTAYDCTVVKNKYLTK